MPGWTIHLEVGERINDVLKYRGQDKEDYSFGCILPDINNGFSANVKEVVGHEVTHWAYDQKSSLNFYEKYKDKIEARVPIYMGYLVHLYTDGFFNYDFFRKVKYSPKYKNLSRDEKEDLKHNDFWLFGTKFDRKLKVKDPERAAKIGNEIKVVDLDGEDVRNALSLFDGDLMMALKGGKYKFYTEEWMQRLMEEMIESFERDYLEDEWRKWYQEKKNAGAAGN